jgi:hypothetical protein
VIIMKILCRWMVVVAVLMAIPTLTLVRADDKKKPDAKNPDAATPQEIAALEAAHEAVGTISKVDAAGKTLTLHIEYQTLQPKGKGANTNAQMQTLLRDQEKILRTTNPVQRAREMEHMMQQASRDQAHALANLKVVTEKVDFDLLGNDDTKIRMMQLPPKLDANGKAQEYSFKERDDSRSPDPALIGYHADWDKLTTGMTVKVYLRTPKTGEKSDPVPVKTIIIQPDPPASSAANPMADTKKDNK